jgi:hypothetical protein
MISLPTSKSARVPRLRNSNSRSSAASRKYGYVNIGCDRGGAYRDRGKHGLRETSNQKIHCPFLIYGKKGVKESGDSRWSTNTITHQTLMMCLVMHLVAAWNLLSATESSRCTHLVIGIPACRQLFALHQEDPQPGHNRSTCPQRRPPGPPPA